MTIVNESLLSGKLHSTILFVFLAYRGSNLRSFKYCAFHKPYGILSQFTSENLEETLSVFNFPKDVYAAGRLDKDSEGLLVLSDDGAFIDELLTPKFDKEKTYWVQVENIPDETALEKLRKGVQIQDYKTKPATVKILNPLPDIAPRIPPIRERKSIPTCWLEIIVTEGKNRQVRKMTAAIGFPTLRLIRMKVGKLSLGDLRPGEWKFVDKKDII